MTSWEQNLRERLSTLLVPDVSQDLAKSLWEPLWACRCRSQETTQAHASQSDMIETDAHHKVPAFFGNKSWDLGRDTAEEIIDQIPIVPNKIVGQIPLVANQRGSVFANNHVKVPAFFLNKEWHLGTSTTGETKSEDEPTIQEPVELPKPDDSIIHLRQRRCSFVVQATDRFGMVLEETREPLPGGLLVVTGLDAWSAFARTGTGACGLMAGDVIVEVNGRSGSAAVLREVLRQAFSVSGRKTIDVVARSRPLSFNIELWREGKYWRHLGIAADAEESNPACLLVQGVHAEGLVPVWNAAHGSLRICKGDLITRVNGVSQDVSGMKQAVQLSSKKGAKLCLTVVTPAGQVAGCQRDSLEDREGSTAWPETTVPWDMQVRWIDDNMSEASTGYGSSIPSGTRTPEENFTSGTCTPPEESFTRQTTFEEAEIVA